MMPRALAVAFLCSLALAGCGGAESGEADGAGRAQATVAPITLDQAPDYAVPGHLASGELGVVFSELEANSVKVANDNGENVLVPSGCPQGAAIDNAGVRVYTLSVDFVNDTTWVELFVDQGTDGLPDSASRTQIASLTAAHGTCIGFDPASSTLYVVDPLGEKIHRIIDTDADGVPDSTGTFLAPGGVLGTEPGVRSLIEVGQYSVVVRTVDTPGLTPERTRLRLEDTDQDGVADTSTTEADAELWGFTDVVLTGESTVNVQGPLSTACIVRVVDDQGVALETLGSVTTDATVQSVSLSRSLNLDENLELYATASSTLLGEGTVVAAIPFQVTETVETSGVLPTEGASLEFEGTQIDSSVTVRCKVATVEPAVWYTCTVTSTSSESLVLDCPEMGLTDGAIVRFEFTKGTEVREFSTVIQPD